MARTGSPRGDITYIPTDEGWPYLASRNHTHSVSYRDVSHKASPHTIAAYCDTFKLLLDYAWQATGTRPAQGLSAISTPHGSARSSSISKPSVGTP